MIPPETGLSFTNPNIKFDGRFEPWLISATKIKIEATVKFDGGLEPWLIPATKTKTNIKFENLPNFEVFNFVLCYKMSVAWNSPLRPPEHWPVD